jgi:AcrR family transcriptional regulator
VTASKRRPGAGRRAGESGTREAILDAARRGFAEHGYDGATIRGIAADAGVNPALVHHFYGTKEQLFSAAMRLPLVPSQMLALILGAERDRLGEEFPDHIGEVLIRGMLAAWDIGDVQTAFLGMLRSAATTEQGVTMLREFLTSTILTTLAEVAGPAGADMAARRYRASLVASQIVGLGFTRYVVGLEPLVAAGTDDLVAAIGPVLQRYLTGDLGLGRHGRAYPHDRGRQFPIGPGPAECAGPPGEVVEQHAELGVGHRIGRLTVWTEGAFHVRDAHRALQRGGLGFHRDLRQVLDGPGAPGAAAAVSHGADRLVAEREGYEDAVDGVLQHRRDAAVVLRRDHQVGVALPDLGVPASHDGVGVGGVTEIPDRPEVLAEHRQRPVTQVEKFGPEGLVTSGTIHDPAGDRVRGSGGPGASDDHLQRVHGYPLGR